MVVLIVAACLRQQSRRPILQFEEVGQAWDLTGNT